jgi:hypothetical protein
MESLKGVTPTFCKNKFFFCANRSIYKIIVLVKNFPKINLAYDALHGMAYYIFLKSLRSLEEFRKNPHVKIPPKSSSTNFPSLGKFKIQFLFENIYSSDFSPLGSAGLPTPPALACRPAQPPQPKPPSPPQPRPAGFAAVRPARADGVFCEIRFLLDFAHSVCSAFSLSAADTWAPPVISFFFTEPAPPRHRATAPRAALAAPRDTVGHYRSAPHHSSLNPLQTRA